MLLLVAWRFILDCPEAGMIAMQMIEVMAKMNLAGVIGVPIFKSEIPTVGIYQK